MGDEFSTGNSQHWDPETTLKEHNRKLPEEWREQQGHLRAHHRNRICLRATDT